MLTLLITVMAHHMYMSKPIYILYFQCNLLYVYLYMLIKLFKIIQLGDSTVNTNRILCEFVWRNGADIKSTPAVVCSPSLTLFLSLIESGNIGTLSKQL